MKANESIVFFGSGPVAAASLQFIAAHFAIEAVVTKPATKEEMQAVVPETSVYETATASELTALINTKPFASQLGIIVDFGIIVEQLVIDYFRLGVVNSHFSLLPRWRGADPISFAILAGDKKTGVSLMLIEATLDTGKLLAQKSLPIAANDTTPSLTKKLIKLSNQLLIEYIPPYLAGELKPRAQPHPDRVTHSRKLTKADGIIDWHKPAVQLEREVRAFSGWPGSRTELAGREVIITAARVEADNRQHITDSKPGHVFVTPKKELAVQTGGAMLIIEKLKPAGKNEMSGQAFLAGHRQLLT